jgi:ketosteroid isomerase-like protein
MQAVQAVYDGWVAGGLEGAMKVVPEDIVWETPPTSPEPEVVHGRGEAQSSMQTWLDEWHSVEIYDLTLEDFGDQVLASLTQRAIGRTSGVAVEGPLHMVWSFSDGRLTRMQMFLEEKEARAAVAAARPESA